MTTMKTGNSSTLDIISRIKAELPVIQKGLPPQLQIHYLNDQSIFVRAAIKGAAPPHGGAGSSLVSALMPMPPSNAFARPDAFGRPGRLAA